MVPDALVLLETVDVVANVPDDELPVRAAADEDGRLERVPRKRLISFDSQFHILHNISNAIKRCCTSIRMKFNQGVFKGTF